MGISRNSGAGIDTIIFAIKTILYNTEEDQKVLTPRYFGKTMKGYNVHDHRKTLKPNELTVYKNQLLNAYDYWSDDEWDCKKIEENTVRLIFTRKEQVDRGKRE